MGLQTLWPYLLTNPDFFRFRVFFRACSLQNEVGDPPFFYISGITNSTSYSGKSLRKKSMLENVHANVLKSRKVTEYSSNGHEKQYETAYRPVTLLVPVELFCPIQPLLLIAHTYSVQLPGETTQKPSTKRNIYHLCRQIMSHNKLKKPFCSFFFYW